MNDAKGWAAWRVTLASAAAIAAVALVVAVLMAPLFYGALALTLDLINLATAAPDLVPKIGRALNRLNREQMEGVAADQSATNAGCALSGAWART